MPFNIRPMQPSDVQLAIDWAAAEGWNPGLNDPLCFYVADPAGFLIGELDNKPVGCISAVRYEDSFGFLGLYIVLPEYRGLGYGLELWNAGLEHLSGRNIGLDGVVAQQDNYRKSGFVLEHRNIRYELKILPAATHSTSPGVQLQPLEKVSFEQLLDYDLSVFRFCRDTFLAPWISQPGAAAFGAMTNDRLSGYGVIRPCRQGWKIGPLFADSDAIADSLITALISGIDNVPVYLDVPETNSPAIRLAENYDMKPMFETARMYTKGDPGLPLDRIFGITTFELG